MPLTPQEQDSKYIFQGSRIEVRGAEWIVTKTERTSHLGNMIHVKGIDGITKGKEAIFIDSFEERFGTKIRKIDPTDVEFVPDDSPRYIKTRLYLQAHFLNAIPTGKRPVIGHKAAIDDLPYQLKPAEIGLKAPRVRILIADDVGLGKTLEAGILASELIVRGRAKRILVVVTKSMLTQFQKEFWTRFGIPLTRLDSEGIRKVRNKIPSNHNPFYYFDRSIISIDTLKNTLQYRTALEESWWDLVIIDEAHNIAERRRGALGRSQRSKLAELLASRSDSLVLLSATPHDGSKQSFASLMTMLDPTSIADPESYGPDDIKGLYTRRFRTDKDVKQDIGSRIPKRKSDQVKATASSPEERAFDLLAGLDLQSDKAKKQASQLFKIIVEKSLFSSPAACAETLEKKIQQLARLDKPEQRGDLEALTELLESVRRIRKGDFSKYGKLRELLEDTGWSPEKADDRLVIFTERIATQIWLAKSLKEDLGLSSTQVVTLHGGMADVSVQEVVDDFGQEAKDIRILIATDLASEGINLHHQCHRLVHFDLPWSMMTFQQRNGRIDRYGQRHRPLIWYLMTESANRKIQGDQRILQILLEKYQHAEENIGDPSVFLGTNDQDEQENRISEAIAEDHGPEEFERNLEESSQSQDINYNALDQLLNKASASGGHAAEDVDEEPANASPMMFDDLFAFSKEALEVLKRQDQKIEFEEEGGILRVKVPEDFKESGILVLGGASAVDTRWMPREAEPSDGYLHFSIDKGTVNDAIEDTRANDETSWPQTQYLWEINPFMTWLKDRLTGVFPKRQVPLMESEGLVEDEVLFVVNGVVPNKRGDAIVDEWLGVRFKGGEFKRVENVLEKDSFCSAFAPPPLLPALPESWSTKAT